MEYNIRIETSLISTGCIRIKYKGLTSNVGKQWEKIKIMCSVQ
jgi:hypothetical protein